MRHQGEIFGRDDLLGLLICRLPLSAIIGLRYRILRSGLPPEAAQFPGDDEPSTWHVGVVSTAAPEAVLSCGSFMLNTYKDAPAWQLRGMATEIGYQGKGFGGKLLTCAEAAIISKSKISRFWCNARVPAIPFYQKNGWKIDSEEFDIPTAGPHRKMLKIHQFNP